MSWSITGGADEAAFDIDSSSGALSFSFTPDYETPVDTGSNNTYEVKVTARDGNNKPSEEQTIIVSVINDETESERSGVYGFERTTDLTDVDTGIGLFNKNVLINYLVSELSNNFGSLNGGLAGYSSDLAGLEFDYKTISGSLDMSGFNTTSLTITANNVLYRGTPVSVSGSISAAQVEITLNGTFTLTGSASDVANGVYTNQTGTMTLGSSISVTPVGGVAPLSQTNFLPTSEISLNFDGTLDFDENDLTITDTSKVTVNYDCLLYTSPSPRDKRQSRMPSSA